MSLFDQAGGVGVAGPGGVLRDVDQVEDPFTSRTVASSLSSGPDQLFCLAAVEQQQVTVSKPNRLTAVVWVLALPIGWLDLERFHAEMV